MAMGDAGMPMCGSVQFCSVLFCSVLFCSVLFCTVLYCGCVFLFTATCVSACATVCKLKGKCWKCAYREPMHTRMALRHIST